MILLARVGLCYQFERLMPGISHLKQLSKYYVYMTRKRPIKLHLHINVHVYEKGPMIQSDHCCASSFSPVSFEVQLTF